MKTPMRLIAKIRLMMLGMVVAGLGMALFLTDSNHHSSNTAVLRALGGASFGVALLFLAFFIKYQRQRAEGWRDYVRGWGVPALRLLEKMQGAPSGKEVYTDREASVLADTFAPSGRYLSPGLLGDFQMLQERGWIYLAFAGKGREDLVARPTEQAWAAVDELCPRDWSPEDFINRRLASHID